MNIEKQSIIDQVTVTETGVILYRTAERVVEDGKILSASYHRVSISPGESLENHPANVLAIAQAAWTPGVIEAHKAAIAAQGV